MNNGKMYATVMLSLEEVDVVLNALEEKALNVQALRQNIYDSVKAQIPEQPPEPQNITLETDKENKKKSGKQKDKM